MWVIFCIKMKLLQLHFTNIAKGQPIYQYLAIFSGTLAVISYGTHYGWPSPSLPQLLKEDSPIPMTNDQSSWIVVVPLFGTLLGAYVGGALLDRIGRKKVILMTSIPLFTSWIMIAFANSVAMLICARFIGGFPDGLLHCAFPMYFGEITNPNIRGFAGSYISVCMALGMLLSNVIGSYFGITTTSLLCSIVPILLLLTFWWMPESPYYLLMKGRIDDARENLKTLKGKDHVDQELERLANVVAGQNSNKRNCYDVFTGKNYRKTLFLGIGIRVAQQFTGTNAITFYAQTIFKESGNGISPTAASSIFFATYMAILAFSSLLVDKIGRKPLMIVSIIGTAVSLLIVGSYFYILNATDVDVSNYTWVPFFALVVYIVTYSIGMQPVPTVLVGELFPTNVKAVALTLCSNTLAVSTIAASKFFQITKDEFGMHVPFFGFFICCVLSLVFILFVVPETKGKTLEEIQEELNGKRVDSNLTEFPEKFRQVKD